MKTLIKTSCVAALALVAMTFGTPQAQARGWPIAAGVVGGLAVGTAVGATVALSAAQPVYYSAPPRVYVAPRYYAPAPVYAPVPPAVAVTVAPPYYYAPGVVAGAPYPYFRAGYGWGPRYYHGGHYFRR